MAGRSAKIEVLARHLSKFFKKTEESGFVWCRPGVFIYMETIASILKIGHMVKSCEWEKVKYKNWEAEETQ